MPTTDLVGVARLLGVAADELRVYLGRNSAAPTPRRAAALARALYCCALSWLVRRINVVLKPIGARGTAGSAARPLSIDLVEFAGYERRGGSGGASGGESRRAPGAVLGLSSAAAAAACEPLQRFEQLCINYADERMHSFATERTFARPQRLYEREGVELGLPRSVARLRGGLRCADLFCRTSDAGDSASDGDGDGDDSILRVSILRILSVQSSAARAEAAAAGATPLPTARLAALSASLVDALAAAIPADDARRVFWQPGQVARRGDAAGCATFYVAHTADAVKTHALSRHSALTRYAVADFVQADAAVDSAAAAVLIGTSSYPWLTAACASAADAGITTPRSVALVGALDALFGRLERLERVRFVRCLRSNKQALRSTLDARELARQLPSLALPMQRQMAEHSFPSQMSIDAFQEWCRPLHPAEARTTPAAILLALRDSLDIAPSAMRHRVRVGASLVCMKASVRRGASLSIRATRRRAVLSLSLSLSLVIFPTVDSYSFTFCLGIVPTILHLKFKSQVAELVRAVTDGADAWSPAPMDDESEDGDGNGGFIYRYILCESY